MANTQKIPVYCVYCTSITPDKKRRIAACIKACDGISTKALEKGIISDLFKKFTGAFAFLCSVRISYGSFFNVKDMNKISEYIRDMADISKSRKR